MINVRMNLVVWNCFLLRGFISRVINSVKKTTSIDMSMTVDVENVEGAAVTASSATGRKNLECANIQDNTGAATFAAINAMNNGAIGGVAANQFVGRALAVYIVLQQVLNG
uniref:Uncharacterized protein n=1 Tax=Rhizophagus irregularis (strain DAOM 181602 / DAOM 197198 / MUCL 43194) TaxID=747089 RepID=U9UEK9_RHIID